jgi:anti-sigma B factor antagonist
LEPGVSLVIARGEVDMRVEAPFEAFLREAADGSDSLLVDLCAVSFIDSTGLRTLLQTRARLAERNRRLALACEPGGPVMRLLQVSGAMVAFDIYPTREWALAHLRAPA